MRQYRAQTLAIPSKARAQARSAIGWTLGYVVIALAVGFAPPVQEKAKSGAKADEAKSTKVAESKPLAEGIVRINDITSRYRFTEKYSKDATQSSNAIGQYRVASKFTIKTAIDRVEGAPERTEGSTQVIYSERPVVVGVNGQVLKTVRQYEKIRVNRITADRQSIVPTAADGLMVWYESRLGEPPLILSLSQNRRLQELEYQIAATQLFMPDLMGVLPISPSRIGDSWRVTRPAVQAFLGERQIRGDNLVGKFVELRHDTKNGTYIAVFQIQGNVRNQAADTAVNAEVFFTFVPPPRSTDPNVKSNEALLARVEAQGSITDVRMGLVSTVTLSRGTTRLKQTDSRELLLQRKLAFDAVQLPIPDPTPLPTPENSWITMIDPKGRYQFRHPQNLQPESSSEDPESIVLRKLNPEGPDTLILKFSAENENPEDMYKKLQGQWESFELKHIEVRRGKVGYLEDSDWPDKKVYHAEAAMIAGLPGSARTQTIYNSYYLIRFRSKGTLTVTAITMKDPPISWQRSVEELLKTFKLGVDPPAR